MSESKIPLTFRIYKGDSFIREETLMQRVSTAVKIGKLSSSHLRLDDESVSRMHAVIEVTGPNDISIIDLGSTKGTVVNGQKVNKAKLQDGDMVVLGDLRVELKIGAPVIEDDAPTRVSASPAEPISAPAVRSGGITGGPPTPAPGRTTPPPVAPPAGFGGGQSAAAMSTAILPPANVAPPPGMIGMGGAARGLGGGNDSADDITGARAIEVAAMLGDSVIDVKHLKSTKGGKISTGTYALFGIGAGLMLLSLIGFGTGIANASYNRKSHHQWIEVEKKAERDWRPRRISLGFDFMAFGGLVGSIGCFLYGLVGYRREKDSSPFYKIGSGPDVDFPTDSVHATSFPLVGPVGDDFAFTFQSNMDGEMTMDGQSVRLADLSSSGRARPSSNAPGAMEVPIPLRARFRVQVGNQTFLVSSVPAPRTYPVPLFAAVSTAFLGVLAATAVIMFGGVGLLQQIPPDPRSLADDLIGLDDRDLLTQIKQQEDPKQEELEQESGDDEAAGGTGTKMALDEGKMGKKESTRAAGQYAMKNNDAPPQLAKQQQLEQARNAGIVGVLSAAPGGAFASLTGSGDFSSGLDDADVFGGLIGNEVGEMAGGYGYGLKGVGPGGGGTGWGTIGTGKYGLIGHGSGTGSGYGTGSGSGGGMKRKSSTPTVNIGSPSATGSLDKETIRRYILRKKQAINYCYEKKLQVKQDLNGTVVTAFQITPEGVVKGARASGLGDREVESCIADVISTIQFPTPKGGGFVNVTSFPFILNPSGG